MAAIDKNSVEYKAILKYANVILTNAKKDNITDLLEFKKISRVEILKECNREPLLNGIAAEIFETGKFDKHKGNYYKKHLKTWHYNVFKSVVNQLGLNLKPIQVTTSSKLETGHYAIKSHIVYSIVEK